MIGVALAVWGLRLTRFEDTSEGLFYTPHSYLGTVLSLLLICRILYRIFQAYDADSIFPPAETQDFVGSPITLLLFGMLAGYYFFIYAAGILRWQRTLRLNR